MAAAAQDAPRCARVVLPLSLPQALAHRIWAFLPFDTRLRCREVCPAWRDALNDAALWARLDFAETSPRVVRVREPLVDAAVARAQGMLAELSAPRELITQDTVLEVLRANSRALRVLKRLGSGYDAMRNDLENPETLAILLRAAPQLQILEADANGTYTDACAFLRNEDAFCPLRLRNLMAVEFRELVGGVIPRGFGQQKAVKELIELLGNTDLHPSLKGFGICRAALDDDTMLGALVDAALARRLSSLRLWMCHLTPASIPAIARVLGSGALRELAIIAHEDSPPLLEQHGALQLGMALHSNTKLEKFAFECGRLWSDTLAAVLLFDALVGHASIREINLSFNDATAGELGAAGPAVAGGAIAKLVAANSPVLESLHVNDCRLGDAGLGPVFAALAQNTHLRELSYRGSNPTSVFTRREVLPAVHANTSLRVLKGGRRSIEAINFVETREQARLRALANSVA